MKDAWGDHAYDINNQLKLLSLVGARKEREPSEEFDHNASHAPHVDGLSVGEDSEHDLRGTIKPTLDVGIDNFFIEGPAAKVSDDDATLVFLLQQDILWLQVTVDDAESLHVFKGTHELNGKPSYETFLETSIVVHLYEFIQIQTVQVECHAEMVSENKVVLYLNDALLVFRVILFDQQKKLGLNGSLVIVLLLILNEFHSHHLLCFVVETFQDLAKSALPNLLNNLESEANLVVLGDPIVSVGVIIAVVDDSLGLGRVDLVLVRGQVVDLLKLLDFGGLRFS